MGRDHAETIALQALDWLLREDRHCDDFLNASGLAPEDLRKRAGDADVLLAVVDFLLMDDARVIAFCTAIELPYGSLMSVRTALPGGAEYSWT